MRRRRFMAFCAPVALLGSLAGSAGASELSQLAQTGTVSERFQAYNIEMVEVTGGRFWAPYGGPPGEVYRQRAPIDLTNRRLIALAGALGPSYLRVSGTWANNTYLAADGEKLEAPPQGFSQVLSADQWRAVVAFSRAVDAPIVTSFAASGGVRNAEGVWTPVQAQRLVDLTREAGGALAAAEFFNEPNVPGATSGMPPGYGAQSYARDFRVFRDWARRSAPEMKIIGPGGVGEGSLTKSIPVNVLGGEFVSSQDMMAANPGALDAVSYHFYGAVSQRCAHMNIGTASKDEALDAAWLDRTREDFTHYSALRDQYEPGKDLWNTETAQAACGGSPWAATFLDTFRYLNQLGLLARLGVKVVMHNTLAASDYALLDQDTLDPRPNYWAAVLWRRTMGARVLAAPAAPAKDVRLYAHCLPSGRGGVGLVALNTGETQQPLKVGYAFTRWVLTGQPLETRQVLINGKPARADEDGRLEGLDGEAGRNQLNLPARSATFISVPDAANAACR